MPGWPAHPVIYEINTWVWLEELSRAHDATITLGNVPAAEWDRAAENAADAVWLMGAWERSPTGTEVARAQDFLLQRAAELLPDAGGPDGTAAIVGSPYCVQRYAPDEHLGGWEGLDTARAELKARGVKLLLDYVPNHVAPDHPWVAEHPEYLIRGDEDDLEHRPADYARMGDGIFAFGRELQGSPPWSDVVQVNAFHRGVRAASIETLSIIASHCDGVRCDMAMLAINDIFARCWGERAGPQPEDEYWPELIGGVRACHGEFVFLAEAYWDREWQLMQQGFDFCYDKVLCDRLIQADASSIRQHLVADRSYQRRLVRFIENHDEERAAAAMSPEHARAAAVAIATLPGATLFYEGQFQGLRTRLPVALGRRPHEPANAALEDFYRTLLPAAQHARDGDWQLVEVTGWPDNDSCRNLAAWSWQTGAAIYVVLINFSANPADGRVHFPVPATPPENWVFTDLLAGDAYERDAEEVRQLGLYARLPGWGFHLLRAPVGETGHDPL